MAGWNPGDGDLEVLSAGDEERSRAGRARTAALAAVCLVLGAVLALRLDHEGGSSGAAAASRGSLRAGSVADLYPCRRRCLLLPLFNGGRRPVEVTAVGFDGWRVGVPVRPAVIEPHAWGGLRFGPPDCSASAPGTYRYVQVQTSVAGRPQVRNLRLPSSTALLQHQHALACPVGGPVTLRNLRGHWLLESAQGSWQQEAGSLLMRYGADGSFRWGSDGNLTGGGREADGRYVLDGRTLTVMVRNQNACHTGDVLRWRVTETAPDRLHMRSVRDPSTACGSPGGEVWVVRRIVVGRGTPGSRPDPNRR